jgi:hypothetical protein
MNEKLKKILSGVGVLATFGLGGAAVAGAQGDKPADKPASSQPAAAQPEAKDQGESDEAGQKVTGADTDRAGKAALQSVGDGKVVAVDKETPETGADKAEPGEKPDSAKEHAIDQKTAYSVEVRKGDGTTVDVALDDAFNVLASEQDNEQGTESSSEQAADTPEQR